MVHLAWQTCIPGRVICIGVEGYRFLIPVRNTWRRGHDKTSDSLGDVPCRMEYPIHVYVIYVYFLQFFITTYKHFMLSNSGRPPPLPPPHNLLLRLPGLWQQVSVVLLPSSVLPNLRGGRGSSPSQILCQRADFSLSRHSDWESASWQGTDDSGQWDGGGGGGGGGGWGVGKFLFF